MLDTKRYRPHQVLGDARQFEAALEQQRQRSQQPSAETVAEPPSKQPVDSFSNVDPAAVPQDIWAAAQLLGDTKGVRLLRTYEELSEQRDTTVQQISLNHTRRQAEQQQEFIDSVPAGLAGSAGLALSRRHHAAAGDPVPGQTLSKRTVMDTLNEVFAECQAFVHAASHVDWADHEAGGNGLTFIYMQQLGAGHDARILAKWAAQQALWQQQINQLAAATGKHPEDVTLNRGGEWRQKRELLTALEVAVPAAAAAAHKLNKAVAGSNHDNRDGSSGSKGSVRDGDAAGTIAAANGQWMATLRGANERFVRIGNAFSGLFLSLKTSTSESDRAGLTTIRRPVIQPPSPAAAAAGSSIASTAGSSQALGSSSGSSQAFGSSPGISSSPRHHSKKRVSGVMSTVNKSINSTQAITVGGMQIRHTQDFSRRGWGDEPYLKEKLAAGAPAVKALASVAPEAGELYVTGSSIEDQLLSSLAVRPVGLDQVEARLAVADPALFKEYQAAKQAADAQAAAEAAAAAEKARREAAPAADNQQHQGPHLQQDTDQLSLHYNIPVPFSNSNSVSSSSAVDSKSAAEPFLVGISNAAAAAAAAASDVLTITNTGTTAVYYTWVNNGRQRPEAAMPPQQPAAAAAAAVSSSAAADATAEFFEEDESTEQLIGEQNPSEQSPAEAIESSSDTAGAAAAAVVDSSYDSDSSYLFYMPNMKGVILPGEVVKFRYGDVLFSTPALMINNGADDLVTARGWAKMNIFERDESAEQ